MQNEKLRNVAIIAHVDHGKTTLVDEMLKQGGVYRENQETVDRVMDSNDLERERGITILAKNTAIQYGDTKINIVDTPGHADFGGEVERILKMVNGVILLVDAAEGAMPQTRFVLSRALELGHRVIVVVNKIDRPDQRIHEVIDEVLELLLDLDATDDQLDSPMLFCSGRQGIASYSPDVVGTDLKPLFDTILDYIPAPEANVDEPFQMLVSSIDYNEFVGRIAIGRIERGTLKQNQEIAVCNYHDPDAPAKKAKAVSLYEFDGLGKKAVTESTAGNIISLSGIGDITIGDTICAPDCVEPLPFVKISAPTMEMTFSINDSPYAGREGKYVTFGHTEHKDAVKWLEYLEETFGENIQIILHGVSMGAATVMLMSGNESLPDNVKMIVTDCGYTSAWDEFEYKLKDMGVPSKPLLDAVNEINKHKAGFDFKDTSALESVKKATKPMLFIHGGADTFVPTYMASLLYDACASEKKDLLIVDGADHAQSYLMDTAAYRAKLDEFVDEYIKIEEKV